MKNKKDLWLIAVAVVSILLITVLFIISGTSKSGLQDDMEEIVTLEEAKAVGESEEEKTFIQETDKFVKQFVNTLPEGYVFSKEAVENPERDNCMQLEILYENGNATDIAIVFNGKDAVAAGSRMALTIKEDCIPDDADAIIKWYLFTFLEGYTEEKKKSIYNDYLYLFDTGSKDYRVYTEEDVTVMMSYETEKTGNFFYVMVLGEQKESIL